MPNKPLPTFCSRIMLTILGLFMTAAAYSQGLVIVKGGHPRATIVVAADANEKVSLAAQDLQSYVTKISGAPEWLPDFGR